MLVILHFLNLSALTAAFYEEPETPRWLSSCVQFNAFAVKQSHNVLFSTLKSSVSVCVQREKNQY